MENRVRLIVRKENDGKSISDLLHFYHVGRGKKEELRGKKRIFVNSNVATLSTLVRENDVIEFISNEKEVVPFEKEIKVLYEDDYYIAVYKEKGILIHSDGNNNSTLINMVSSYLIKNNKNPIIYPVHRIDVETSGIVLFSKNFISGTIMDNMVLNHELTKIYLLWVKGILKNKKGELNFELGKDRHNSNKMIVKKSNGLKAITKYEVIKEEKGNSFIKARLITGRKHQIRVSFAYINHPLIGDSIYGNKIQKERLSLEASYLSFIHPFTNEKIEICTDLYNINF